MPKQKTPKSKPQPEVPPPPPSWPPFRPPLPVSDLTVETLVPEKVVVIRGFFPRSLCRDYVSFLKTLPLVTTPGKPKRGEAVRVNDRHQIEDAAFARRLWLETGLSNALLAADELTSLWYGTYLPTPFAQPSLRRPPARIARHVPNQQAPSGAR